MIDATALAALWFAAGWLVVIVLDAVVLALVMAVWWNNPNNERRVSAIRRTFSGHTAPWRRR